MQKKFEKTLPSIDHRCARLDVVAQTTIMAVVDKRSVAGRHRQLATDTKRQKLYEMMWRGSLCWNMVVIAK